MIFLDSGDLCDEAKAYYYDFLGLEAVAEVPRSVRAHVEHCEHCRGQIDHLGHLLAQSRDAKTCHDSLTTQLLTLHFSHLGQAVTCACAKPFIPSLVDPALPVRVTTPITRHVDQCSACQNDLAILESLGLTGQQHFRLGQFLADQAQHADLPAVAAWADQVAELRAHNLSAAQLKQVCLSPRGRSRICALQQTRLDTLSGGAVENETNVCGEVSQTDLFEYALPYGSETELAKGAKPPDVQADHIRGCPVCLKRLRAMQKVLFDMAERPDSEVITVMTLPETKPGHSRALNAASRSREAKKPSPRIPFPVLRACAAVLVLMLGFIAVTQVPRATAFEYGRMQAALESVRGIHITTTNVPTGDVCVEVWGLLKEDQWLVDQKEISVFWDCASGTVEFLDKGNGKRDRYPIPPERLRDLNGVKAGLFGVLPGVGHFPSGAEWKPGPAAESSSDTVTWELIMPSGVFPNGKTRCEKRVYILDAATFLPRSLEFYSSSPKDGELELKTVISVTYPEHLDLVLQREALNMGISESP